MRMPGIAGVVAPWRTARLLPETPVLLALSGGADSVALMHLLHGLSKRDGFPLKLAHLHHGIRGAEADRDQAFCRALAEKYGLELFCEQVDVPALAARSGHGLEETARQVRYAWFADLMREQGIPLLVTAHHADDNLETLLFRLCRGSGTGGLSGISPIRDFASGVLVRPLLQVTRSEILAYCEENQLEFVIDSTNSDTTYTRNRLRAEVVPVLEELFGAPQMRAGDAARALAEDDEFLCELAKPLCREAREQGMEIAALERTALPVRKRALLQWITQVTGHVPERVHLEALLTLADGRTQNAEVALPGDWGAIAECGFLHLLKREQLKAPPMRMPLELGEVTLADRGMSLSVKKGEPPTKVHNLSTSSCIILKLKFDIMESGFYWRTLEEGDVLLTGGMHKKLSKLYARVGIPPCRRVQIPLLCDARGIVWAPFVGARDGLGVDGTSYALSVSLWSTAFNDKIGKDV